MSSNSLERLLFDASAPTDGPLVGSYLLGAGGTVITETGTALDVNISGAGGLAIFAEDSAATSGNDGQSVLMTRQDTLATDTSADGDYSWFKGNAKGELYVIDSDGNALLTTIDADTSAMAVDLAAIEVLLTSIDSDTGNILTDTNAMVVDLAAMEVLLTSIDSDTGNILTDTNAMVIDLAAIEVLITAGNASLVSIDADTSTIAGDTTSMDAILTALSKAEDSVHVSGDQGIMGLGVRSDTQVSLASATGDYTPSTYESLGRLRIFDAPDSSVASAAVVVGSTAVALPALSGRARVLIQNNGNKPIFVGPTGVTVASGIEVSKGGTLSLEAGPNVALFAISTAAGQDVRVLELA